MFLQCPEQLGMHCSGFLGGIVINYTQVSALLLKGSIVIFNFSTEIGSVSQKSWCSGRLVAAPLS